MITKGSWLQKDGLPYGRRTTITSAFRMHKAESHGCRNLEFSEGHKKKTRRSITTLESWADWDNAPKRRVLFHQELEREKPEPELVHMCGLVTKATPRIPLWRNTYHSSSICSDYLSNTEYHQSIVDATSHEFHLCDSSLVQCQAFQNLWIINLTKPEVLSLVSFTHLRYLLIEIVLDGLELPFWVCDD